MDDPIRARLDFLEAEEAVDICNSEFPFAALRAVLELHPLSVYVLRDMELLACTQCGPKCPERRAIAAALGVDGNAA